MKQVLNTDEGIVTADVSPPACGPYEILVRNHYSVVSAGTETASLHQPAGNISGVVKSIAEHPGLILKALELVRKDGFSQTIDKITGHGDQVQVLGYSSAGIVTYVGSNIRDIAVGDRVACAGAGYANHAEIVAVPRNLAVKVPNDVSLQEAAFATLGAIAMQGIRRADLRLGETCCVIGLGLLGQIACQILATAGVSIIGVDVDQGRVERASRLKHVKGFLSGPSVSDEIHSATGGMGADAVIIYAATPSSDPVRQAMGYARKKGRVVIVGSVGMDLLRSPFYEKELDLLISCSYGPGRYDPLYEEKGVDYPVGYVRWTENRNMQEFVRLLSEKDVNMELLTDHVVPVEKAADAYRLLASEQRPIGIVFQYNTALPQASGKVLQDHPAPAIPGSIRTGFIGAGQFAQAYHLPNLNKDQRFQIRAIATKNGIHAKQVARQYQAAYFTTDSEEILNDPEIDLVIITTRHNLHAPLVIQAAEHRKNILIEKPIAMTLEECRRIQTVLDKTKVHMVMGFNRRFAPVAQEVRSIVSARKGPIVLIYRINSTGMKKGHWINDPVEGGGAILGEGCHVFDFCRWIIGSNPRSLYGTQISSGPVTDCDDNNIIATMDFNEGSIASVVYTTIGNSDYPKEQVELFFDGNAIMINDFRELIVKGDRQQHISLKTIDKGHARLIKEYGNLLKGEDPHPDLPRAQDGIAATLCALAVQESIRTKSVQTWDYPSQ